MTTARQDGGVACLAGHGWRQEGEALVRELRFRDFDEALAFLERISADAVDYGRRPDVCISWNLVRLSVANPHHARLTDAEIRLAAKVDAALASSR